MSFLSLSNVNVKFAKLKKLTWRSYDTAEALPITCKVALINKRKFVKVTLDKNYKTFVIYVAVLEAEMLIHLL